MTGVIGSTMWMVDSSETPGYWRVTLCRMEPRDLASRCKVDGRVTEEPMLERWTLRVATPLLVLVAGCETSPPPPGAARTSEPVAAAIDDVATTLEAEGLNVERTADGLRATSAAPGFTRCDPVNVRDGSGDGTRNVFTPVSERQAVADIHFTPIDPGTRVSWQTSYSGRYHNRVNNTWFERSCDGTGSLERLLESAVQG